MTAEPVENETVWSRTVTRDWTWDDLQEIPDDGHRYEIIHGSRLVEPAILAGAGVPAYWRVELTGAGTPLVVVHALAGEVYREVMTVRAGEPAVVDEPYRVELRPADLAGPRRRG